MTQKYLPVICLLILAAADAKVGNAQNYPSKPIRLIVGSSPNSGADFIARIIGQKLTETWGQPVLIDPRAGAGSIVATELVAKAAPDGYTIVIVPTSYALNPSLYRKLPYDSLKDLTAVNLIGTQPTLLVVHPSLPVKSVRDLVSLARSRPGQVNYASSGVGSGGFLAAELFKSMAKVDMVHIPYKGPGPALIDLVGGQVDLLFTSPLAALPQVENGRLRAVAVTSKERVAELPHIPTVAESGVADYEVLVWNGLLAPAGTPRETVIKLGTEFTRVLQLAEVKARLRSLGFNAKGSTPEEFMAFVQAEMKKWGTVIADAGIQPR